MSDPRNDTNVATSPNPAEGRGAQLGSLIPEAFSASVASGTSRTSNTWCSSEWYARLRNC